MNETSHWVEHTHEVIRTGNLVGSSMVDMETGKRGFLITGLDSYLEPYYGGFKAFDKLIKQGIDLTSDNPKQIKRWENIKKIKEKWILESADPEIKLRREVNKSKYNIDDIIKTMSLGIGKFYIDAIRLKLDEIIKEEEVLLNKRLANQEKSVSFTTSFTLIGTILILFFTSLIAFIMYRNIQKSIKDNSKKDQLLLQQSKLAAMGEMVGAIAHQWRQPLNAIALQTQFIEDDFEDGLVDKEYLKTFSKENMKLISFMSKTIDDFRNFFTIDKIKKDFSVKQKIKDTSNMLLSQLKSNEITLEISDNDFTILGYESEFQQVIINLINNAKDALVENKVADSKIKISIKTQKDKGIIEIKDNAGGIPQNVVTRIFEPYFTTKEQGKGTGLGLYMSKMIIEDNMHGSIQVENEDEGAVFIIQFKI